MAHYFTNEKISSAKRKIMVNIKNTNLTFITDNGVFSKKGLDFGTRSLLENIDLDSITGDVLDFGCGYGPIGIYIKKNKNVNVDMVDINERALSLALENAKINNTNVNIFKSDIYDNVHKKYDFIITNPPIRVGKEILYKILFGATNYLKDKGKIWLVISKDQGAKTVLKDLGEIYDTTLITKNKGFYIICGQKR